LFAIRELLRFYGRERYPSLLKDEQTMVAFLRTHANAYAYGPGHGGMRQGATGFRWFSPPENVHAIASIYLTLYLDGKTDPLAWWRTN
jgi:hypothetical protein